MNDGTVTGTFGEAFGKLGNVLNKWETWGTLLLIGIGFVVFKLTQAFLGATVTKDGEDGPKAGILAVVLLFAVAAAVAFVWDQLTPRPY